MNQSVLKHINNGKYVLEKSVAGKYYRNICGWTDYLIGSDLLYSHRITDYTRDLFDETYHSHDYYEVIVYIKGNVDYICEKNILKPPPASVVWFSPGDFHNTRLLRESCYERYVFRFPQNIFHFGKEDFPLLSFITAHSQINFFSLFPEHQERIFALLDRLDEEVARENANLLLCFSYFIQLFAEFEQSFHLPSEQPSTLPAKVLEVKEYIENYYAVIDSVSEISSHFFYSREYISRSFKKHFNISVAEYLTKYRVTKSLSLLESGKSITETGYAVGFKSLSAFTASFKKVVGYLPSEYIRQRNVFKHP